MTQTEIAALLQGMRAGTAAQLDNVDPARDDEETMRVERLDGGGFYGDNGKWDWKISDAEEAAATLHRWGYRILAWRGAA